MYLRSLPLGYIMQKDKLRESVKCGTQTELLSREITRVLKSAKGRHSEKQECDGSSRPGSCDSAASQVQSTSENVLPGQVMD